MRAPEARARISFAPPSLSNARAAAKEGRTIIYTTQILEVVERFSDRVAILQQGELRAFDTVDVLERSGEQTGLEQIFQQLRSELQ